MTLLYFHNTCQVTHEWHKRRLFSSATATDSSQQWAGIESEWWRIKGVENWIQYYDHFTNFPRVTSKFFSSIQWKTGQSRPRFDIWLSNSCGYKVTRKIRLNDDMAPLAIQSKLSKPRTSPRPAVKLCLIQYNYSALYILPARAIRIFSITSSTCYRKLRIEIWSSHLHGCKVTQPIK